MNFLKIVGRAIAVVALAGLPVGMAAAAVKPPLAALAGANSATNPLADDTARGIVQFVQRRGGAGFRGGRGFRGQGIRGRSFRSRGFRGRGIRTRGFARGGYRGGYRRNFRRNRWVGPAIAAGVAGSIFGSTYYRPNYYGRNYYRPYYGRSNYYRTRRTYYAPRRRGRSAWQRCDNRFRSFRWSDGTYQPYGNVPRRLCPYLR